MSYIFFAFFGTPYYVGISHRAPLSIVFIEINNLSLLLNSTPYPPQVSYPTSEVLPPHTDRFYIYIWFNRIYIHYNNYLIIKNIFLQIHVHKIYSYNLQAYIYIMYKIYIMYEYASVVCPLKVIRFLPSFSPKISLKL